MPVGRAECEALASQFVSAPAQDGFGGTQNNPAAAHPLRFISTFTVSISMVWTDGCRNYKRDGVAKHWNRVLLQHPPLKKMTGSSILNLML